MEKLFISLTILFCLTSYGQTRTESQAKFEIDKNIIETVESKLLESEFGKPFDDLFLVYESVLLADFYENDSLIISTKDKNKKMPFKSFFYKSNDTISIDGAYGLFGGFGFSIKFVDGKPTVYHMLAGDDFPEYSKTIDGELKFRIEVACSESKLTLSKLPELKNDNIVHGMVEFKSENYYSGAMLMDKQEHGERKKTRMNMKIFFKSRYVNFEKK